jgi:hypothetical protein
MMVFVGGTPLGGPVMGWVTDTFGARVGFLSGGLVSAAAAVGVGLVLARAAGLRPQLDLRRGNGRPLVAFVPRSGAPAPAPEATPAGDPDGKQPASTEPALKEPALKEPALKDLAPKDPAPKSLAAKDAGCSGPASRADSAPSPAA